MFMSEVCTDNAKQREGGGTEMKRGTMKKGGGEKKYREAEKKR